MFKLLKMFHSTFWLRLKGSKGAGRGKYKGVKQIGFLHYHAVEKLELYKEELKQRGFPITPDTPIFVALESNPYNKKGDRLTQVTLVFWTASLIAWKGLEDKRFSAQDFRDVLQSALENANVHQNIAAPLLGHKVKGVDKHYSSHELEEFLQAFRSTLPWIVPQTVEQVKAESEAKFSKQEKSITQLEYENIDLKDKITHVRTEIKVQDVTHAQEITQLKAQIGDMYKYVNKNLDPLLDVIDEITKMDFLRHLSNILIHFQDGLYSAERSLQHLPFKHFSCLSVMVDLTRPCEACGKMVGGALKHGPKIQIFRCYTCWIELMYFQKKSPLECPMCDGKLE